MIPTSRLAAVALTTVLPFVAGIDAQVPRQREPLARRGWITEAQQAPGGQVTITATAVIRGRVTSAASGAPIRSAEVRVRETNGRDNRLATADDQGRFEVHDLTAGEWRIQASKAGFVTQQFGQNHPFDAVTPIKLANGQRFTADMTLIPGAAIAGHVVDEAGEPIAGALVQVMRTRVFRGRRELMASGVGDQTDDTGAFRVYGLVPGDYYVSATLRAPEDTARGTTARVETYFPGTRNIGEAQRVTLRAGEDQSAITIPAPRPAAGVEVSGVVFTSSGAPAASASVHLYNADDLAFGVRSSGSFVDTDAAGRFTADKVAPGSYVIEADAVNGGSLLSVERAATPIEVGSAGVTGVTIATRPVASLTGTIVADERTTLPRTLKVEVTAQPVDGAGGMHAGFVGTQALFANGAAPSGNRFTMPGLSGRYVLDIAILPEGWILKALEINGEDVADGIVDFTNLGPAVNARVVLTNRGGEMSGTVTSRGQPTPATVIVFPSDTAKWTYPSRFVRTAKADADGRFHITGLLASRYRAIAVSFLEEGESPDGELLERIGRSATEFAINEGEKKSLQLTLVQR